MGRSIEEMNLFRLQSCYGVSIHLYQYFRVGMPAVDACAGNIMCFFCQVLGDENFITCFHYSGIIHIYILHEKPCTDTIVCQFTTLFHELHHIVVQ